MRPIVPPPYEVQRRAWECAFALRDEPLPIEQRVYVEVVYRTGPEGLGWHELARMFVLYGQCFDVRV